MSEVDYLGPTVDETYEDITKFDNIMFIANPIRAMKFAEFLSYISEYSGLRIKLMRAGKDSSFSRIADAFQNAHTKDYKDLGESDLPKAMNDFLDELKGNKNIEFSTNEIGEIQQALDSIFALTNTGKARSGIKDKLLKLVS